MGKGLRRYAVALLASALLVAMVVGAASASPGAAGSFSGVFRVDATDAEGNTGFAEWALPVNPGATVGFSIPSAQTIKDANGNVLGTVQQFICRLDSDPVVFIDFAVTAGNNLTTFTFGSPTVNFAAITNPLAYATANMTIQDNNNDTVASSGQYAGPKAYRAIYNGGTDYALLVSDLSAGVGLGDTALETQSGNIAGSVTSINSLFKFKLTAHDSASGQGTFVVVPEPGSLLALGSGLAGMVGLLARKRK